MKHIQSPEIIERRRKILEAAERIFKRKGIEDASIRKIALEAGVITGAIYPYFDGKEEIYAELLSEWRQVLKLRCSLISASFLKMPCLVLLKDADLNPL